MKEDILGEIAGRRENERPVMNMSVSPKLSLGTCLHRQLSLFSQKHVEESNLFGRYLLVAFMTTDQRVSEGGTLMEVLYRSCCGIDVHKQFLVACLLVVDEAGQQHKELRRFSTMTPDLLTCIDWLKAAQCRAIAMESTGVYMPPPMLPKVC